MTLTKLRFKATTRPRTTTILATSPGVAHGYRFQWSGTSIVAKRADLDGATFCFDYQSTLNHLRLPAKLLAMLTDEEPAMTLAAPIDLLPLESISLRLEHAPATAAVELVLHGALVPR